MLFFTEILLKMFALQMSVCDDKCGGKGLGVQDMDLNECPKCIGCVKCIDCEVDCNDTSFYGEEYVNTSEATSNCKMSCLDCHTRKSGARSLLSLCLSFYTCNAD